MNKILYFLLFIVVLSTVACSETPIGDPGVSYVSSEVVELRMNEPKWEGFRQSKPYVVTYSTASASDFAYVEVFVNEFDQIYGAIFYSGNGAMISSTQTELDGLYSIEMMLEKIEETSYTRVDEFRVSYDENYGYPRSLFIDQDSRLTVDDIAIVIRSVRVSDF